VRYFASAASAAGDLISIRSACTGSSPAWIRREAASRGADDTSVKRRYYRAMEEQHPLAIGETVPDIALPDSDGHPRRLSDLAAGGLCVIVFYRGHW